MKKINIFFLFVLLQICILFWIIGNYEYIKSNWKTVYIQATGYDPVDIFRGDYVKIAYKLKLSATQANQIGKKSLYGKKIYIVPKQEKNLIVWVEEILTEKPNDKFFIEISDTSVQSSKEIKVRWDNNQVYTYIQDWCNEDVKQEQYFSGKRVSFSPDTSSNFISYVTIIDEIGGKSSLWNQKWVIEEVWGCEKFLTFRALSADKFFVSEGTWIPLQEKIIQGNMYAKLKVIKNGKVLLLDIVEKGAME